MNRDLSRAALLGALFLAGSCGNTPEPAANAGEKKVRVNVTGMA